MDEWLKSTRTPEKTCAEIVSALQREIKEGSPITGMLPFEDANGRLCFIHKYEVVGARKI